MKERGMIFNGEMVRAILDGRKTQTRRIIKDCTVGRDQISKFIQIEKKFIGCYPEDVPELIRECCPYGVPGDRIWVREAFRVHSRATDVATLVYKASERNSWTEQTHRVPVAVCNKPATPEKWTPSLHMPRWASRILLEITDVRVERLNSISQEDAQAEGLELTGWRPTYSDPDSGGEVMTPYDNFAELWSSIYGDESWQANPWVWVIEFKRVEGGAA
ncbi:hypothetical protein [Klebsiella pneumoniae]|uniref:hypothetical protein n=2 Tax=Klebsiella pneumoniae TaxID=573 RepID=UPI0004D6B109|nr:hypothetical protein [Klebsiella pneumoniae]AVO94096.1 hypothetical protein AM475_04285 [Klebsiella pneumoniae subsp. ozaenae]AZV13734.1 hypothetical protein EMI85_06935 [Klebsiella pneumoniae]EIX9640680.1 hypothetical protein [Klebsiella pneumoniae]EKZ9796623.1 hypothetical protein [Klebsiella pneumoniae]KEC97969.1 hypothetical protein P820_01646 [Klebsiella pneumoniae UCI 17]